MSTSRIIKIKQNSLGPNIRDQITVNGQPFDLTGYTVKFRMQEWHGGPLIVNNANAVVENQATFKGWVHYDQVLADVAAFGRFRGEWRFTDPSNNPVTLPAADYVLIVITRELPL